MPGARSVIVLAAKIPDAAVEVAGHHDEQGKTFGPRMWHGYVVLNWDLSSATPSPRFNGGVFRGRRQRLARNHGTPPTAGRHRPVELWLATCYTAVKHSFGILSRLSAELLNLPA